MSSSEKLETAPEKRRGPVWRRRARMVAIPAMLLSLTVGGLGMGAAAHAADGPGCSSSPQGCPPPPPPGKGKGKAPITGDFEVPVKLTPGKMQATTLKIWQTMEWPNHHNIGDRDESWKINSRLDQQHHEHAEWVETGGQYLDKGDSLRDFMDAGLAGPSSSHYIGTFQEYVAHVFTVDPSRPGTRTGQDRFVRAIGTGDVWFTRDHYNSFSYLGKGPFK